MLIRAPFEPLNDVEFEVQTQKKKGLRSVATNRRKTENLMGHDFFKIVRNKLGFI